MIIGQLSVLSSFATAMPAVPTPDTAVHRSLQFAIFASGSGSNAEVLIRYFAQAEVARVGCVVTNNPQAGVIARAENLGVPVLHIPASGAWPDEPQRLPTLLAEHGVQFVVLAGYLKKIPPELVAAYPRRIVNIHPALLPKFGGKGMYGERVHQAVLAAHETVSGITIHYVDEHYDSGDVIFQAQVPVLPGMTAPELLSAIHVLEHAHFPRVLAELFSVLNAPTV